MGNLKPTISTNSDRQNWAQVNDMVRKLNYEQQTKIFNGPNNTTAVTIGRYADGRYGLLIADDSGTNRILIGQAPNDGRPGAWVSKEGKDVLTLLS